MNAEDVDIAINAINARWRYQPPSDNERMAYRRTLSQLDLETFGECLSRLRAGSPSANQPGQRPSVGDFMAVALSIAAERRREQDQEAREADPWPDVDLNATHNGVEAAKAIAVASGAVYPRKVKV